MRAFPIACAVVVLAATAGLWRRASREQRAIGLVVALGFAVYGSGLVHPPSLEHLIEDVGTTLGSWTYLLVGVLAFLETGAFVGLVAPGELTVILGGVVAGQGRISIVVLIALVWACAVAGDLTTYLLGRRLGREFLLRHGPRVKITEARLEQVEDFFARRGSATILIGRFIGLVRALAPFVAGTARLPLRRFLPVDVLAAGAWSAGFCLLGYVFWASFHDVVTIVRQGSFAVGAVVVVVAGALLARRELRDPERRAAVEPYRAPAALLALALLGAAAFGLLVGDAAAGRVPGADRWAHHAAVELDTGAGVAVAKAIAALGDTAVVVPLIALAVGWLLLVRRRLVAALTLGVGATVAFLASPLVKGIVARPRPEDPLVASAGESFPSGHAVHAVAYVAVALLLARELPSTASAGRRIALVGAGVAVALLIGLTRIYLRAHWLTDVVAGWGLAAAIFCLCGLVALVVPHLRDNEAY